MPIGGSRVHRIAFRVDDDLNNWLDSVTTDKSKFIRKALLKAYRQVLMHGYQRIVDLLNRLNYKEYEHIYISGTNRPTVRLNTQEVKFIDDLANKLGLTKSQLLRAVLVLDRAGLLP